MSDASALYLDTSNSQYLWDDPSRLSRFLPGDTSAQWVTWALTGTTHVTATTYFWYGEAIQHFTFLASSDNATFTALTPTITDEPGNWDRVTYVLNMPPGTNYVRVVYPANTIVWTPQLGQMILSSPGLSNPKPTATPTATPTMTQAPVSTATQAPTSTPLALSTSTATKTPDATPFPLPVATSTQAPTQVPVPTPTVFPPQLRNVLTNGGFEAGTLSGWILQGTASVITTSARTGSYGVTIQGPAAHLDQVFSTVAGQTYSVTGWIRLDDQRVAATWGGVRLEVVDAGWKSIKASIALTPTGSALGQWVPVTLTFVAPGSSARIKLENFSDGDLAFSADDIAVSSQTMTHFTFLPLTVR